MQSCQASPTFPALVVDGSSINFFAGILGDHGKWLAQAEANTPALESLFPTVQEILDDAAIELSELNSYIYCEGPGSVLGLRLCAMAVETWRRLLGREPNLYSYNSLKLVASQLLTNERFSEEALLISDWKKDLWNGLIVRSSVDDSLAPVRSEDIADWSGLLYHLPARKGWQQAPNNAIEITYNPSILAELIDHPGLLKRTESVLLFQAGSNKFQKWTPARHSAVSK